MTLSENLNTLQTVKEDIKSAILRHEIEPTGGMTTYADAINKIDKRVGEHVIPPYIKMMDTAINGDILYKYKFEPRTDASYMFFNTDLSKGRIDNSDPDYPFNMGGTCPNFDTSTIVDADCMFFGAKIHTINWQHEPKDPNTGLVVPGYDDLDMSACESAKFITAFSYFMYFSMINTDKIKYLDGAFSSWRSYSTSGAVFLGDLSSLETATNAFYAWYSPYIYGMYNLGKNENFTNLDLRYVRTRNSYGEPSDYHTDFALCLRDIFANIYDRKSAGYTKSANILLPIAFLEDEDYNEEFSHWLFSTAIDKGWIIKGVK